MVPAVVELEMVRLPERVEREDLSGMAAAVAPPIVVVVVVVSPAETAPAPRITGSSPTSRSASKEVGEAGKE